ncbi:hypothetical protein EDB98_105275 [Pseudomonas fluorescens]|nr:hypothetical protein EDB98_105275 [Pseudomonas fluorescens]SFW73401.1 hypothetical protein SAMN03159439_04161 [Pseudomonas sp. NFACC04-2]
MSRAVLTNAKAPQVITVFFLRSHHIECHWGIVRPQWNGRADDVAQINDLLELNTLHFFDFLILCETVGNASRQQSGKHAYR